MELTSRGSRKLVVRREMEADPERWRRPGRAVYNEAYLSFWVDLIALSIYALHCLHRIHTARSLHIYTDTVTCTLISISRTSDDESTMKTLGTLAVLTHAFLVMGQEAHIDPRGGGFGHGGGGGGGHGYGARGYGGPFGDGGSGCAVSPAPLSLAEPPSFPGNSGLARAKPN